MEILQKLHKLISIWLPIGLVILTLILIFGPLFKSWIGIPRNTGLYIFLALLVSQLTLAIIDKHICNKLKINDDNHNGCSIGCSLYLLLSLLWGYSCEAIKDNQMVKISYYKGKMVYHEYDCHVIHGKEANEIKLKDAKKQNIGLCDACKNIKIEEDIKNEEYEERREQRLYWYH